MATQRITITLDQALLDELRGRVPTGEVSAYVAEARRARLRLDPIMEMLRIFDEIDGPLTDEEIAQGEREWNQMNERLTLALESSSDPDRVSRSMSSSLRAARSS